MVIDRWERPSDFDAFQAEFGDAYAEHDRRFHRLHAAERRLGSYEPVEGTRP